MVCGPLKCRRRNFVCKQRYILVILLHFALVNSYLLQIVYNTDTTEMTEDKYETLTFDECSQYFYEPTVVRVTRTWENNLESLTLYSFYVGHMVAHVPGGWLADRFGARAVLATGMSVAIVANAVLPVCVENLGEGSISAVVLRAVLGLALGPVVPCVSSFIQEWVPMEERGFLGGVAFGGVQLGTVLDDAFTGFMMRQSGYWSLPFYVWSGLALLWLVLFIALSYSSPESHPHITDQEREFLMDKIGPRTRRKVPWLRILSGGPFWALLAGHCGHSLIAFTMLTYMPMYMKDILKLNVHENALFTAFPFLVSWTATFMFSSISDLLTNRKLITLRGARVLYTCTSSVVPSMLLFLVIRVGCHRYAALTTYTLAVVSLAPSYAGLKVNANDLTQNFAATITAVINGVSVSSGIYGPFLAEYFAKDKSIKSWSMLFLIVFAVAVVTSIVFATFAQAERQEWDEEPVKLEEPIEPSELIQPTEPTDTDSVISSVIDE